MEENLDFSGGFCWWKDSSVPGGTLEEAPCLVATAPWTPTGVSCIKGILTPPKCPKNSRLRIGCLPRNVKSQWSQPKFSVAKGSNLCLPMFLPNKKIKVAKRSRKWCFRQANSLLSRLSLLWGDAENRSQEFGGGKWMNRITCFFSQLFRIQYDSTPRKWMDENSSRGSKKSDWQKRW